MDFAEAKAQAPQIPGYTCPIIDRMRMRIEAVQSDLQGLMGTFRLDEHPEEIVGALAALDGLLVSLETVRASNHRLRESSYYWYNYAKDKEG